MSCVNTTLTHVTTFQLGSAPATESSRLPIKDFAKCLDPVLRVVLEKKHATHNPLRVPQVRGIRIIDKPGREFLLMTWRE
ncbi:hypothetical protein KDI_48230 [Dictyobacter arantiisoli]|uniref:Uncharacterized protein n=1 Tax=Dictyobacter arantiisoli TaxID=2014874 RepID=A0A5A5TJR1_9CHLR|nr:hypothetical protein KDI_48230 [Dictyobacter arantiisoli]